MNKMVLFGAVGAVVVLAAAAVGFMVPARPKAPLLTGNDFGAIRRQALALYPIGSQIGVVAKAVEQLGFRCQYREHAIENITAPTVSCDMGGAASSWSRNMVVLVARNGALTDIAVSNVFATVEANARTPDPPVAGQMSIPVASAKATDPTWDQMVGSVAWKDPDRADKAESGRPQ